MTSFLGASPRPLAAIRSLHPTGDPALLRFRLAEVDVCEDLDWGFLQGDRLTLPDPLERPEFVERRKEPRRTLGLASKRAVPGPTFAGERYLFRRRLAYAFRGSVQATCRILDAARVDLALLARALRASDAAREPFPDNCSAEATARRSARGVPNVEKPDDLRLGLKASSRSIWTGPLWESESYQNSAQLGWFVEAFCASASDGPGPIHPCGPSATRCRPSAVTTVRRCDTFSSLKPRGASLPQRSDWCFISVVVALGFGVLAPLILKESKRLWLQLSRLLAATFRRTTWRAY